jgi:hypothetical protein
LNCLALLQARKSSSYNQAVSEAFLHPPVGCRLPAVIFAIIFMMCERNFSLLISTETSAISDS